MSGNIRTTRDSEAKSCNRNRSSRANPTPTQQKPYCTSSNKAGKSNPTSSYIRFKIPKPSRDTELVRARGGHLQRPQSSKAWTPTAGARGFWISWQALRILPPAVSSLVLKLRPVVRWGERVKRGGMPSRSAGVSYTWLPTSFTASRFSLVF